MTPGELYDAVLKESRERDDTWDLMLKTWGAHNFEVTAEYQGHLARCLIYGFELRQADPKKYPTEVLEYLTVFLRNQIAMGPPQPGAS